MHALETSQPGSYSKENPMQDLHYLAVRFLDCFKHILVETNPCWYVVFAQLLGPSQHTNTGHKVNWKCLCGNIQPSNFIT